MNHDIETQSYRDEKEKQKKMLLEQQRKRQEVDSFGMLFLFTIVMFVLILLGINI